MEAPTHNPILGVNPAPHLEDGVEMEDHRAPAAQEAQVRAQATEMEVHQLLRPVPALALLLQTMDGEDPVRARPRVPQVLRAHRAVDVVFD